MGSFRNSGFRIETEFCRGAVFTSPGEIGSSTFNEKMIRKDDQQLLNKGQKGILAALEGTPEMRGTNLLIVSSGHVKP